jgi:sortase (surface protein transpeptidase)
VTLITCTDGAAKREVVVGSLEKTYPFNTAPNNIHKYFETKYNQLKV